MKRSLIDLRIPLEFSIPLSAGSLTSISLSQRADTRKSGNDVRHQDGEGHLKDPATRHFASENRVQVVDTDQDDANYN